MLGVTGSVATIKMNQLASLIHEFANVKIVATKAARHFFSDSEEWGGQADGVFILHLRSSTLQELALHADSLPERIINLARQAEQLRCLVQATRTIGVNGTGLETTSCTLSCGGGQMCL